VRTVVLRPIEPAEFTELPDRLRIELLVVDTEAASFHRHQDRVYLLQLSSRTEPGWWILAVTGLWDSASCRRPRHRIVFLTRL
jgi:hypothetical protein